MVVWVLLESRLKVVQLLLQELDLEVVDGHVVYLLQLLVSSLKDVHEFALISFSKHLDHVVTCTRLA